MRARTNSSVYTTVNVTSGDTTSTSSVSKNGDDVIVVGVNVIHRPVRWAAGGNGFFARDFVPIGKAAAVAVGFTVVVLVIAGWGLPTNFSGIRAPASWRRSPAGISARVGGRAWLKPAVGDGFGVRDLGRNGLTAAGWRWLGSSVVRSAAVVCDVKTDGIETLLVSPRYYLAFSFVAFRIRIHGWMETYP